MDHNRSLVRDISMTNGTLGFTVLLSWKTEEFERKEIWPNSLVRIETTCVCGGNIFLSVADFGSLFFYTVLAKNKWRVFKNASNPPPPPPGHNDIYHPVTPLTGDKCRSSTPHKPPPIIPPLSLWPLCRIPIIIYRTPGVTDFEVQPHHYPVIPPRLPPSHCVT